MEDLNSFANVMRLHGLKSSKPDLIKSSLPDEYSSMVGSQEYMRSRLGLSRTYIVRKVLTLIKC